MAFAAIKNLKYTERTKKKADANSDPSRAPEVALKHGGRTNY